MTKRSKPILRTDRQSRGMRRAAMLALLILSGPGIGGVIPLSWGIARADDVPAAAPAAGDEAPDFRAGSLTNDEPQAVYATAPDDSWNRIFHDLFTRTVAVRLSDDFPEGKPFERVREREPRVSSRVFQRIESGDRAVDPFYPSHFVRYGRAPFERWAEPRFDSLKRALEDACDETSPRSPLARALMQGDAWAAFDRLSAYEVQKREEQEQRSAILSLLARFTRKLALTPGEIKALPDNFAAAAGAGKLPDLFFPDLIPEGGPWLEIVWLPERIHDHFFDFRRVARVFVKPPAEPADKASFVNGLRNAGKVAEKLDSVALVIQGLLIDQTGEIVPAPLTYEVQVRRFLKGETGRVVRGEVQQHEVSRRLLLADAKSGGFESIDPRAPIYTASAGNDLDFASDSNTGVEEAILVRLETRCISCHSRNTGVVLTFAALEMKDPPPVTLVNPADHEHARSVARRKAERKDFRALMEYWK